MRSWPLVLLQLADLVVAGLGGQEPSHHVALVDLATDLQQAVDLPGQSLVALIRAWTMAHVDTWYMLPPKRSTGPQPEADLILNQI